MEPSEQLHRGDSFIARISGAPVTSSMVLADRVREEIFSRRPEPGTYLFGLNELRQRVGFGPSVIREALNQLAAEGLIEIRRGPKGGVYVRRVGADVITKSLGALVSMNGTPRKKVIEARLAIEGLCARLAAVHATEEDIGQLAQSVSRSSALVNDSAAFAEENVVFHLAIVEATHNDIIIALTRSLREMFFRETVNFSYNKKMLHEAQSAHEELVNRISSRRRDEAHRLMSAHIREFNRYVEFSGQTDEPTEDVGQKNVIRIEERQGGGDETTN